MNVIGSGQVCNVLRGWTPLSHFPSQWSEDVVPTVAFNFRKVRRGNVTLKIWDVAGQPRYRSIWERYCNGVDAVV